jgi:hypothetical protein
MAQGHFIQFVIAYQEIMVQYSLLLQGLIVTFTKERKEHRNEEPAKLNSDVALRAV